MGLSRWDSVRLRLRGPLPCRPRQHHATDVGRARNHRTPAQIVLSERQRKGAFHDRCLTPNRNYHTMPSIIFDIRYWTLNTLLSVLSANGNASFRLNAAPPYIRHRTPRPDPTPTTPPV